MQLLAVAAGGAIGSVLRYAVSTGVHSITGRGFPYGTMVVNIAGSLLMGLLFVLLVERMDVPAVWRMAVMIGLLGAFTTFSTFSIETLNLLLSGDYLRAVANIVFSIVLCIGATWIGFKLGRLI